MVLTTIGLAGGVARAAVADTLVAPFLANVEGQGLAVLAHIRAETIAADTAVGQTLPVTGVGSS